MVVLFLTGLAVYGAAQDRGNIWGSSRSAGSDLRGPNPIRDSSLRLRLVKESFEKTQKDTAELYNLASELKAEMETTSEDVFSITVMKKAEEIEKLAEKIKNRMKNL
jgi:hypothetical protein